MSHDFSGAYSIRNHLNLEHHYLEELNGWKHDQFPTSELMAIHRELHMLAAMERPSFIIRSADEPRALPTWSIRRLFNWHKAG